MRGFYKKFFYFSKRVHWYRTESMLCCLFFFFSFFMDTATYLHSKEHLGLLIIEEIKKNTFDPQAISTF
jgi:hypothetical protein